MTSGSYRWWVVAMLWLVCLFNYADRQAIFSVFPVFKKPVADGGMGLTNVQCGVVGSAFMWVYAVALPFAGLVGDLLIQRPPRFGNDDRRRQLFPRGGSLRCLTPFLFQPGDLGVL